MIIWGDVTNINYHNKSFTWLDYKHSQTWKFFFACFQNSSAKPLIEKTKNQAPSIQSVEILPITSPRELGELLYQLTTLVSTIWRKKWMPRDPCFSWEQLPDWELEPLKRLPLGSHGRQECWAWWHVRHIHYLRGISGQLAVGGSN